MDEIEYSKAESSLYSETELLSLTIRKPGRRKKTEMSRFTSDKRSNDYFRFFVGRWFVDDDATGALGCWFCGGFCCGKSWGAAPVDC